LAVGLAAPVSIFGVIEHEQISVGAQGRAASVSDTTHAPLFTTWSIPQRYSHSRPSCSLSAS
jgi:hypothetical protein